MFLCEQVQVSMAHQFTGQVRYIINPFMMNGIVHHYHLGESTFIIRGIGSNVIFQLKFLYANSIAPDGTPNSAVSHLGLCCLPMSHKKDVRLI